MSEITTQEKKRREFILGGNLYKIILKLSLPIMFSNLIQTVYSLTDTYWVSKIGGDQVAAVGFVWPFIFMYMSLGIGLSIGATAIISQKIGAKDEAGAVVVAGQTFSFMSILSVVLTVAGYLALPWLLRVLGGEGVIYTDGLSYSRIIMYGMPMMYFFFAYQSLKQAEGDMSSPMKILIVSVVMNMILDPLFILYFNWGVDGAAWATTISRLAPVVIVLYMMFKNKQGRLYQATKHLHMKKDIVFEIVKIGIPTAIGRMMTSIGFMVMNYFVVSYGNHVMTAFVLGNRVISIVMMPMMGIGSAATTIVGQNMGAKNLDRTKETIRKTLILSLSFTIVGMVLLFIFKAQFLGLFNVEANVLEVGIKLTNFVVLSLPLMAIFQSMSGFFIGTKHTTTSMFVDIARLWLFRLPVIILFKNVYGMDESSIWYSMLISNFLADLTFFIFYFSKRWQKPVRKWFIK